MRPPARRLYWASGGDILAFHPERGGEPIALEAAVALHGFHLAERRRAARAGLACAAAFHAARERELRHAIRAGADWRRASRRCNLALR